MTLEEAKRRIEELKKWANKAKKEATFHSVQDYQSGKVVAYTVCLKILKRVENGRDENETDRKAENDNPPDRR